MIAPDKVQFSSHGQSVSLAFGDSFSRPRDHGFRDTPAAELLSLVTEIENGRPWAEVVSARFAATKPWLYAIITHATRTAFFPLLPADSDAPVLDIGAGWGQISRPLAKSRRVVSLEPVAERLAFIRAAARQDQLAHNLAFVEADYFDTTFDTRFGAICAIGVLEWAGAFQPGGDPQDLQRRFLHKARQELAPGGALIIGIENRIGLKYLLGGADDHIETPHIACLPAPLARQHFFQHTGRELRSFTYSKSELQQLLFDAGFTHCEFFGAFPDYKLPAHVVPLTDGGKSWNKLMLEENLPPEHNGYNGSAFPPEFAARLAAHTRDLAAEGVAHVFAPSFFVKAT